MLTTAPRRQADLELVVVWTPHRDAPSLTGPLSTGVSPFPKSTLCGVQFNPAAMAKERY